jgi:hypothetical protein
MVGNNETVLALSHSQIHPNGCIFLLSDKSRSACKQATQLLPNKKAHLAVCLARLRDKIKSGKNYQILTSYQTKSKTKQKVRK